MGKKWTKYTKKNYVFIVGEAPLPTDSDLSIRYTGQYRKVKIGSKTTKFVRFIWKYVPGVFSPTTEVLLTAEEHSRLETALEYESESKAEKVYTSWHKRNPSGRRLGARQPHLESHLKAIKKAYGM